MGAGVAAPRAYVAESITGLLPFFRPFGIGDRESLAVEGVLVQAPGGTTHWFRYGRGGGEMLTLTSGDGASAFFTDVDRNVSPENPDPGRFIGIAESHGLHFPRPPH